MTRHRGELYPPAVEAYWEAIDGGRLVVPTCAECEETFFPPRAACPYCLSTDVDLRESAGEGELYSFSVVRTDGHPVRGDQVPYTVALVALHDGPTLFSTVVDCSVEDLEVGLRVAVEFDDLGGDHPLPVFVPVE